MFQLQPTCEYPYECEAWIRIFQRFDVNHDGYIPTHELKRFVRDSAKSLGLQSTEAKELLDNVDVNRDHLVDFAEFCLLMSKAKRMRLRRVMFRAAQMVVPKGIRTKPFSYLQQYNCFPPPLFMLFISIIEVAFYIYYVLEMEVGLDLSKPSTTGVTLMKSPLIFNPEKLEEVWRFLTYMLVHVDFFHLAFNVLTQLILGIALELVHKLWRVSAVYIAGVLAGSLLVSVVDPSAYLAGASGGVYALLAAHISELLVNWSEMEFAAIRALILIILIGSDLGVSIYQRYFEVEATTISYTAHIGGFLAGVLMGIIVLRNFRKKPWEKVLWWISTTAVIFLTATLIVLNIGPRVL
ncbi:unnamed protein product [Enterobius vermicularis]|uniref:rhomboid protease n=1 Tax=Enterobius vermicularis TaxID=51028 RepID=A0A0N4VG25_ENTVE|nr:unnamed protein product [Enterobius vermicularis]